MIVKNGRILQETPNSMAGHLKFSKSLAREFREAVRAFDSRKKQFLRDRPTAGETTTPPPAPQP
jgi:hypothetical protein